MTVENRACRFRPSLPAPSGLVRHTSPLSLKRVAAVRRRGFDLRHDSCQTGLAMTLSLFRLVVLAALSVFVTSRALAQAPASAEAAPANRLFAVQIRTGAKWDAAKPAREQLHFREHSANLKRLRDAGHLVMGARYSDIGFIVLTAKSEAEARAMMDEDPSIKAEVFRYEVHLMSVFYPGNIESPRVAK